MKAIKWFHHRTGFVRLRMQPAREESLGILEHKQALAIFASVTEKKMRTQRPKNLSSRRQSNII